MNVAKKSTIDGPIYCSAGLAVYEGHVASVLHEVRRQVRGFPKSKSANDGLLGSVFALRILVANGPDDVRTWIAKGEVESWRDAYLIWFERIKRKFPKDIKEEDVLVAAMSEFATLSDLGIDLPKSIWQSDMVKALRRLNK